MGWWPRGTLSTVRGLTKHGRIWAGAWAAILATAVICFGPLAAESQTPGSNGRIAVAPEGAEVTSLETFDFNGSDPQPIANSGSARGPAFSPTDDQRIAYSEFLGGSRGIVAVNLDGTDFQVLTGPKRDHGPVYSPSGSKIIFSRGSTGRLMEMDSDGSHLHGITPNAKKRSDTEPSISPDGKRIVFVRRQFGHERRPNFIKLFMVNRDGSNPHAVLPHSGYVGHPDWSPDGKRILFLTGGFLNGNGSSLRTIHPDGTHRVLIDKNAGDRDAAYSPDGTQIAVARVHGIEYNIFLMTPNGHSAYSIIHDGREPAWQSLP